MSPRKSEEKFHILSTYNKYLVHRFSTFISCDSLWRTSFKGVLSGKNREYLSGSKIKDDFNELKNIHE